MKYIKIILSAVILTFLFSSVSFGHSAPGILFEGSVSQGTTHRHSIHADAGQKLDISIKSPENNAVFVIYKPKSNRTIKGAGAIDETRKWTGTVSESGEYTMVVGSTKGKAVYKIAVDVK